MVTRIKSVSAKSTSDREFSFEASDRERYRTQENDENDISDNGKLFELNVFPFNRMQSFRMNTCFAYYDLYLVAVTPMPNVLFSDFGAKTNRCMLSHLNFRNFSSKWKRKSQATRRHVFNEGVSLCFISVSPRFQTLLSMWIGKLFVCEK